MPCEAIWEDTVNNVLVQVFWVGGFEKWKLTAVGIAKFLGSCRHGSRICMGAVKRETTLE